MKKATHKFMGIIQMKMFGNDYVKQHDTRDCAAACMASVCNLYGLHISCLLYTSYASNASFRNPFMVLFLNKYSTTSIPHYMPDLAFLHIYSYGHLLHGNLFTFVFNKFSELADFVKFIFCIFVTIEVCGDSWRLIIVEMCIRDRYYYISIHGRESCVRFFRFHPGMGEYFRNAHGILPVFPKK